MKKILVTGATGFLGNYVINELLRKGCAVTATSARQVKAAETSWVSKVSYIPFDLRNMDDTFNYKSFFGDPDAIIHLAWEGLPNYKAVFHTEENLPRHIRFLQNLIRNGIHDITVTGTCLEYGMQQGCLSEKMAAMPENSYAVAKDKLRKILETIPDLQLKWLRLFYMYGKGQSANSLFSQLDSALENGEQVFNMSGGEQERDFLPVGKMATHIVHAALQDKTQGIINCCSGKPATVRKMVENYLTEKGKTIQLNLGYYPYPDYEPMSFWGDNTKLKSMQND